MGGILGAENSWFWGSVELEATDIMVFVRFLCVCVVQREREREKERERGYRKLRERNQEMGENERRGMGESHKYR